MCKPLEKTCLVDVAIAAAAFSTAIAICFWLMFSILVLCVRKLTKPGNRQIDRPKDRETNNALAIERFLWLSFTNKPMHCQLRIAIVGVASALCNLYDSLAHSSSDRL